MSPILKFMFLIISMEPLVTIIATPKKEMSIPPTAFLGNLSFKIRDAIMVVIIGFVAAIRDVFTLLVYFNAVKKNTW